MRRTILCIGRSIGLSIPLAPLGVVALLALRNPPCSLFVGCLVVIYPTLDYQGPVVLVVRSMIKAR
jgi:hypothetical protein